MKRFVEGVSRDQITLFPEKLEDFIAEDNPVRVIEAFVEGLDPRRLPPMRWIRLLYSPSFLLACLGSVGRVRLDATATVFLIQQFIEDLAVVDAGVRDRETADHLVLFVVVGAAPNVSTGKRTSFISTGKRTATVSTNYPWPRE